MRLYVGIKKRASGEAQMFMGFAEPEVRDRMGEGGRVIELDLEEIISRRLGIMRRLKSEDHVLGLGDLAKVMEACDLRLLGLEHHGSGDVQAYADVYRDLKEQVDVQLLRMEEEYEFLFSELAEIVEMMGEKAEATHRESRREEDQ